jgi:hypothetical protein
LAIQPAADPQFAAAIYDAQFASIRASRVKAMDETPIKAGRSERGKMRMAYFCGLAAYAAVPCRTTAN